MPRTLWEPSQTLYLPLLRSGVVPVCRRALQVFSYRLNKYAGTDFKFVPALLPVPVHVEPIFDMMYN